MPIKRGAKLSLVRIHLSNVRVTEFQVRYPEQLAKYMDVLERFPNDDLGVLFLKAYSDDSYEVLDGHHKFLAYIMKGRDNALALIIDESDISNEPSTDDPRDQPALRDVVPAPTRVHAGRTSSSDPRTASVVRQTQAIQEVLNALRNPGRDKQYHIQQEQHLARHWPTLYFALDKLMIEFPKE